MKTKLLTLALLLCALRLCQGQATNALDSWSFTTTNWTSDLGYAPISFTNVTSSLLEPDPQKLISDPAEIQRFDEQTRVRC